MRRVMVLAMVEETTLDVLAGARGATKTTAPAQGTDERRMTMEAKVLPRTRELLHRGFKGKSGRHILRVLPLLALLFVLGCGSEDDDGGIAPAAFPDFALSSEEVALLPTFDDLQRVVADYPDGPVVMVNMLHFRDRAIGLDEELSGAEAYRVYAEGVIEVVESIGGRLLWAARVDSQVVGAGDTEFHELALVEYPDGEAFLRLATDPATTALLEYRSAGLVGQWLIASSELRPVQDAVGPPVDPDAEIPEVSDEEVTAWSARTGLSEDQVRRLLDGPADVTVSVFELLLYRETVAEPERSGRDAYAEYAAVLEEEAARRGALVRWSGKGDSMVLGVSEPLFDEVIVTEYPSRRALLETLSDSRVVAASKHREAGLRGHWMFASTEESI